MFYGSALLLSVYILTSDMAISLTVELCCDYNNCGVSNKTDGDFTTTTGCIIRTDDECYRGLSSVRRVNRYSEKSTLIVIS